MVDSLTNLLQKFKVETAQKTWKSPEQIFFQLRFDDSDKGYIIVVDKNGNETDADFRYYTEPERGILKVINRGKSKNAFKISWDGVSEGIYLEGNEFLLHLLKDSANFINSEFRKIKFSKHKTEIILKITGEDILTSSLELKDIGLFNENIKFLTDSYILSGNEVVELNPLNGNADNLKYFITTISISELNSFLSLVLSQYPSIKLEYKDYRIKTGEALSMTPALIIDKVDPNRSLYLRVSSTVGNLPPDFLNELGINRIASVDDEEKLINVNNIIYNDTDSQIDWLNKILLKYKRIHKNSKNSDFYTESSQFIIEENLAGNFLQSELHNLLERYSVFGVEKIKEYKVTSAKPRLSFMVSSSSAIDFLEGDASIELEGETFSIFDVLNQYRKNSYIQLSDGTKAIINPVYIDKLQRIFKKQKDRVKVSFFDLPLVEELIDNKITDSSFIKSREILTGFNNISKLPARTPKIDAKLRPYQKQGLRWLSYLHKNSLGGCLADDMGLGKTLQTLCLLSTIYPKQKKSSIIVMPRSLLFNWENEIKKFCPHLTFYVYYGTHSDITAAKKFNLILTTYGKLRSDISIFEQEKFYYTILDESQNVKNVNAQVSKAVMLLNSSHRLALSGTPIENNLYELYSLFRFLNPAMFGSIQDFNKFYATPIIKENDSFAMHELKKKIYPFILRRIKKDVLKDLPEKIEQVLYVEMSKQQRHLYEQRRTFFYDMIKKQVASNGIQNSQFMIIQALTELRQIASIPEARSDDRITSPKREILIEKVVDAVLNGHKILIFANFLKGIEKVSEDLEKNNIEHLVMTGSTRNRKELVEKFQNDENCKVFVITIKTGSLGLNLTAADIVFIFDPWWNSSVETQAVDRTHRIGQDKTVFSYKLITENSIEEKILLLQQKKTELFNNLIAADGASIKSLNEQDIEFILS